MKRIIFFLLIITLAACKNDNKHPDVSAVKITLNIHRFEKDFFAMDTLHLNETMQKIHEKYPGFTQDFLFNILGTTPSTAGADVQRFVASYKSIAIDADKKFANFNKITDEIKQGFRYVKYYFPKYKLPEQLISFIGPLNSYGNILTADAIAVGLQLYMGNDYPIYLTEAGQQLYPRYLSVRFDPDYIAAGCLNNIINDMFPDNSGSLPLVEQMVEQGKRWYLLDHFLPDAPDTIKTGYTADQLKACYASEKQIWAFFVQNNLLFSIDPNMMRDYLADAPGTPALGENVPGRLGIFAGWQIVKKWMEKNKTVTLEKLMQTPAKQIFEAAKYKP